MYALLAFGLVLSVGSSRGAEKVREAIRSQTGVSLDFLETVLRQQMTLTQSLQAALEAEKRRAKAEELSLKNALIAAKSEITTLWSKVNRSSKAVGFTARLKADSDQGLQFGHSATLRFDDVLLNAGDGYESHTGSFIAPVAGTYSFFLNLMATSHGTVAMVKNGNVFDYVYGGDGNDQGATQVLLRLAQNDKVWVRHHGGNRIRGGVYTVFTGYLLYAD
uniref:Type 2 C1q domain-containing protein 4 isoform 1 n=1 Tax=Littorina littorea TaxID=31216 RepID=A0A411DEQ0_LITLI|nr:type 2 C1q domain-containing protein 4 isoform 1 [Littorina littorea]